MFIEENDYGRGRFFREKSSAKKLSYGGYKMNPCLSVAISFFVR